MSVDDQGEHQRSELPALPQDPAAKSVVPRTVSVTERSAVKTSYSATATAVSPALQPNLLWNLLRAPFWLFCHCWIRLRIRGHEQIDRQSGGLFLINHQSFLDPLLVAVLLNRPVSYLARDSLFRVPVVGWILRNTYVIPISREAARGGSIRVAIDRIESGFLVGIFPEGTRSANGNVQSFRPGFLALARRTQQPIYPVGIVGANRVMPRGALWIRPGKIQIVVGQPLSEEDLRQFHDNKDDAELCALARKRVEECTELAQRLTLNPAETNVTSDARQL